ncbi:aldehyde dehydrogenase family protein [Actinomadura viridis]|uniref:Acyl-CoA reductase-like NAD-dependent aldehyde dehydrogenase n=1 Tax=Actinomadura viridis TaxID=58110 RepID=A0A931DN20_9ACTN|nr:aldehyde dehydrogenase family protein [Actinomadura viridis]MBG6091558.1 acyl-CoA reductase-like NAD-dependent aldehyde dehydrogenase [Actinomadura viridis]
MDVTPFWLAGRPATGDEQLTVTHPYDGRVVGTAAVPTPEQVEQAVAAADAVRREAAALPLHVRAEALAHVSARLSERAEEVARLITGENGKPLLWARGEVNRAIATFRFAAEEARRWSGTTQRLDTDPAANGRMAYVTRVPKGPVLGISPFNFPLNLAAHKIAPAIAVGTPIVLKPAPATPLSALLLGELLAETDLPEGMFSVLTVPNDRAGGLVEDPRLPIVSFTGSVPVGWSIRDQVPRKHVTLELGGNGAAVVLSDSDLDWAATRIGLFSNYQAGQSCIAVQRVFVDRSVYDAFVPKLVESVNGLVTGDPWDEKTQVGPLVSQDAAERVEAWVDEAVAAGATVLAGGTRDGAAYAPTVLADVPADAKISRQEVFGPVLMVQPVDGVDDAFARVNDSTFGLQAGIFTRNLDVAFRAHRELEVGGVVIGDVPSYRADQMPYGGVKDSGVGREGLHSAMTDYTEEKVMVLTGLPL